MSKEAMKLALEALETGGWNKTTAAITALREALAEQLAQQELASASVEPVAVIRSVVHSGDGGVRVTWLGGFPQIGDLLYTSPPATKSWVGLTDEEVMVAAYQAGFDIHEDYENEDDPEAMHWWTPDGEVCDDSLLKLRDLIEAKLKEKNT